MLNIMVTKRENHLEYFKNHPIYFYYSMNVRI